jgi:hypothetical protein
MSRADIGACVSVDRTPLSIVVARVIASSEAMLYFGGDDCGIRLG